MIELTPKQDLVVSEVDAWLRSESLAGQWRYLAGVAGSGKTTLVKKLAEDRRVLFCAFTGKAASVLREKGCAGATTLHRAIYRPNEKAAKTSAGELVYSTEFTPREDGPLDDYDLIVLDECSMVDTKMATDLMSYGKKVLVTGDPFQLPPINGEGYFSSREPHWFLDEVHRQAAESGILRMATDIRLGRGVLAPDSYGPEAAVVSMDEAGEREEDLLRWCEIVVVGTHRMRSHFNDRYREIARRRGPYPERGEQLVCLQNNHRLGLLNGALWEVGSDARPNGHLRIEFPASEIDAEGRLLVDAWAHDFLKMEDELSRMPFRLRAERARFTYGYAVTCHKAQGSEYADALVIDESGVFRELGPRWLYTAVTRAAKQLVLVRP